MHCFPRQLGLSLPVVLPEALLEGGIVDLLVLREVAATLWVHIVRKHILPVDITTDHWVRVALAVGVEGRLAEVSSESRIR